MRLQLLFPLHSLELTPEMSRFFVSNVGVGTDETDPQELSRRLRSFTFEINPTAHHNNRWRPNSLKRVFPHENDDLDKEEVPCLKSARFSRDQKSVRTCTPGESYDRIMK